LEEGENTKENADRQEKYRKRKMMIRKWWKGKLIGFKVFK